MLKNISKPDTQPGNPPENQSSLLFLKSFFNFGEKSLSPTGIILFLAFITLSFYTFFHYYRFYPLTPSFWLQYLVIPFQNTVWIRSSTQAVLFSLGAGTFFYGLGSLIMGDLLLKGMGWKEKCKTEYFILAMGLGGIGVGFIYMSLGLLGIAFDGVIRIFWGLLILLGLIGIKYRNEPGIEGKTSFSLRNYRVPHYLTLILLLISLGIALNPAIESDALRYHLPIPAQIHQTGMYSYYPYNAFFQFPALIEMQFGFAMAGGWDSVTPQLVHWFHFLLTVLLIGSFARRWFSKADPAWAMAIYASIPFVPIISGWAFIESSLTLYLMLALWTLLRLKETVENTQGTDESPAFYKIILLSGVVIGSLAGMKYSLLTLYPPLTGLVLYYIWVKYGKKSLLYGILFLSCLGLAASPFYLRNFINSGNPVYPMGYSVFGGDYWSQANGDYYLYHAQMKGGLYESKRENLFYRAAELAYLPVKASLNPPGYGLRVARQESRLYAWTGNRLFLPDNFGDWQITPFFLIFIPLSLVYYFRERRKKNPSTRAVLWILMGFCLWYYLSWANSYRDNRFLMPILPILSLMAAEGLGGWKNNLLKMMAVGIILYNTLWMGQTILREHNPLPWLAGRLTSSQRLESKLNYYPGYEKWKSIQRGDEALLLVGEYRPYYLEGHYYVADFFDTPLLIRLLQGAASKEEVYARMKELKIKWIFYNPNELSLYLREYTRHFTAYVDLDLYRELTLDMLQHSQWSWKISRPLGPGESRQYGSFLNLPETDPRTLYLIELPE